MSSIFSCLLHPITAVILALDSENFKFSSTSHLVSTIIISCLLFLMLLFFEIGNVDFQNFCMDYPFHAKCESNCLQNYEDNFDIYNPSSGPGSFLMKAGTGETFINCHHRFPENTSFYWFVENSEKINENVMIRMMREENFNDEIIVDDPFNLETYKNFINSR